MSDAFHSTVFDSPVGPLRAVADENSLVALLFDTPADGARYATAVADGAHPVLAQVRRELDDYFAGARTTFDVPLAPAGTAFDRAVWHALLAIPYGVTWSYRELAEAIGRPTAMRAVGAANGRNPIAILIPCHRVIGADGTLTGYAGGLWRKRTLLALERDVQPPGQDLFAAARA